MIHISWRFITIWLALTVATLLLDQPLATWVHASGLYLVAKYSTLAQIIKFPGTVIFVFALLLLSWLCRPRSPGEPLLLVTSAAASGLFYSLVKWSVGRSRPISNGVLNTHPFQIHPFNGGLARLFIAKPAQSFPSGHASLAFAIATVLAIYFPRGRLFLFGVAGLVAVERVLEGAHYLSDVVAGSGLGIIAACCAARLCRHHFGALYSRQSISD